MNWLNLVLYVLYDFYYLVVKRNGINIILGDGCL